MKTFKLDTTETKKYWAFRNDDFRNLVAARAMTMANVWCDDVEILDADGLRLGVVRDGEDN